MLSAQTLPVDAGYLSRGVEARSRTDPAGRTGPVREDLGASQVAWGSVVETRGKGRECGQVGKQQLWHERKVWYDARNATEPVRGDGPSDVPSAAATLNTELAARAAGGSTARMRGWRSLPPAFALLRGGRRRTALPLHSQASSTPC